MYIIFFTLFHTLSYFLFLIPSSFLSQKNCPAVHRVLVTSGSVSNHILSLSYTPISRPTEASLTKSQAVYQKIFTLLYIDELLELVKQRFCELFKALVPPGTHPSNVIASISFDDEYTEILERVESTTKKRPIKQRTFEETSKGQDIIKNPKEAKKDKKKKNKKKKGDDGDGEDEGEGEGDGKGEPQEPGETETERKRRQFIGLNYSNLIPRVFN